MLHYDNDDDADDYGKTEVITYLTDLWVWSITLGLGVGIDTFLLGFRNDNLDYKYNRVRD